MDLYKKLKQKARNTRDRAVRQKIELFLLALKLESVSEACARRGFSRKFYYKWWNRFQRSGFALESLQEKSRRPQRISNQIPAKVEAAIKYYQKKKHGSRLTQAYLRRQKITLSRSTICHVFNGRKKGKKTKRERIKTHQKRYELPIPGQRFQMDVKYVPTLVDQKKAYTYVIIDECTRWRFARAYDSLCEGTTVKFLEEFLEHCPFPIACIQTDNGQEFTYKLNPLCQQIEHKMDQWCKKNAIHHQLIPPGVKELNGKVERSHRIDMHYFYWRAPCHTLEAFNSALSNWMYYYNYHRPHGGIQFLTPIEKLQERFTHLKSQTLDSPLEILRLKFIQSNPMSSKLDRQIQSLELDLRKLLMAA